VGESISRCCGQGDEWINHGLPMYIAIDRKPENFSDIQNTTCTNTEVLLRLQLVKNAKKKRHIQWRELMGSYTVRSILKYLLLPW
jgi:hypothetical protein